MKHKSFFLILILFLILLFSGSPSQAQTSLKMNVSKSNESVIGILCIDSKIAAKETNDQLVRNLSEDAHEKKSVLLATGLSAILPGAGQFYVGDYWKSALFIAAEAAAITVGLVYDKKGNDQTDFFQKFADDHWSVLRYAKWTVKHAVEIKPGIDVSGFKVIDAGGKVNWNELNRLESEIGNYYSHRLPYYGEQQYYELIGKYPQFNVGWDDFGDENTPFEYDPSRKNLTGRFVYYSVERGKANDYYNIASKAVLVVIANHLISSVEAALSANSFNKNLTVSSTLEKFQFGLTSYYYPQLNLQYRF